MPDSIPQFAICDHCKPLLLDLLEKRIRRVLEVAKAENEKLGVSDEDDMATAQAECFHFMELKLILEGLPTCGLYDDYGPPKTIEGPLLK